MKTFKKSLSVLLALVMAFAFMSFAFAANDISVYVCVEGITRTLFDGDVTVPEGSTAFDALTATGLNISSRDTEYGVYVYAIEGEEEKTFGGETGWDGWSYEVNGDGNVGSLNTVTVNDGDSMLLYYADPWGPTGMQRPVVEFADDYSYMMITSSDTVTDWVTYESVTTVNPVAGATITIDGERKITSDETGKAIIPEDLIEGDHEYVIEKYAENGLPLVLRTRGTYGVEVAPDEPPTDEPQDEQQDQGFFAKIISWFKTLFTKIADFFKKIFNK